MQELDGYRECACFADRECHYCSSPDIASTYHYPIGAMRDNLHLACIPCYESKVKPMVERGKAEEV